MYEEEQPVEVGDSTPSVIEQAANMGWRAGIWHFGQAEREGQIENFNPGLVRRPDGLHLLVRRSEIKAGMPYGQNGIWACKLDDEDFRKPVGGPPLRFPESLAEEQFEDPRAVYWNGQTWVWTVNFTWFENMTWTGAHIAIGVFGNDPLWSPIARKDPEVGTNTAARGHTHGKHNKNVLFWFKDDKLHCLYTSDPWAVYVFGNSWKEQTLFSYDGVRWKYGWVRGGTPPVLVDGLYYTFFHSSMPWRGRYRRYYMGAIAFNSTPPFAPVHWTQEPILIGSQNDPWQQRKPLVVFPCGAIHENNRWLISFGVNDLKCGYLEMPHVDLLKILAPALVVPGMSLLADKTERGSLEPIPFSDKPDEGEDLPVPALAEVEDRSDLSPCVGRNPKANTTQAQDDAGNRGENSESCGGQNSSTCQNNAPSVETGTGPNPRLPSAEQIAKLQGNAAKARAALAAKRAAGTLKPVKRKKRKKKKTLKAVA